ncbi:MAG: glycosyltransferase family 39 protein [Anaerolineales bacterium]|nr:glycosyltransferase family 39 protein [Anaerolineales bacterium]
MSSKYHKRILIAILITAIALRLAAALLLGNSIAETRGGTYDQITYDALAQRVVGGYGFTFASDWWPYVRAGQPTAFWSYLYTLYLALIYSLAGHQPLLARVIQAILVGLAMPWLTYRIGKRIFGTGPALIAAAINAAYLYFITYAASLMTEAFYIAGILWIVDVAMRLTEAFSNSQATGRHETAPQLRLGIELGLAMGMTLLMRQVISGFLVVLAFWFFWLAWRKHWLRQALVPLAVAAVVMVVINLPFIARNYRLFGAIIMPNTNVGINFFWANHPIYGTQFEPVLSPSHGVSYQELIPPELRNLNEAQLDKALLARGLQFVAEDPGRYLLLSLSRVPIYFQFWPTPQSTLLSNVARLLSFGLFLPFIVYGLVVAIRAARPSGPLRSPPAAQGDTSDLRLAFLVLVLLFITVYTAIHLASWANVRYRLPVDAFLILFAGYGLEHLLRHLIEWKSRRQALPQL